MKKKILMNHFEYCMKSIIKDFKFLTDDSIHIIDGIKFSTKFNTRNIKGNDDDSPSLFYFWKGNLYLNNYYLTISVQDEIEKKPHLILENVKKYLRQKYDFTALAEELFICKLCFNYPPKNLQIGYGINLFT